VFQDFKRLSTVRHRPGGINDVEILVDDRTVNRGRTNIKAGIQLNHKTISCPKIFGICPIINIPGPFESAGSLLSKACVTISWSKQRTHVRNSVKRRWPNEDSAF
jgi:hypothetical protein